MASLGGSIEQEQIPIKEDKFYILKSKQLKKSISACRCSHELMISLFKNFSSSFFFKASASSLLKLS